MFIVWKKSLKEIVEEKNIAVKWRELLLVCIRKEGQGELGRTRKTKCHQLPRELNQAQIQKKKN